MARSSIGITSGPEIPCGPGAVEVGEDFGVASQVQPSAAGVSSLGGHATSDPAVMQAAAAIIAATIPREELGTADLGALGYHHMSA